MEPSEDDINLLRQTALDRIEASEPGQYHTKDIERVKNDRAWLRRFLLHLEMDQTKAINMLMSNLAWRQKLAVNDITHTSLNLQVLLAGGMFPHSRDKDGRLLFIIKVRLNVKGQHKMDDIKKCVIYWMERIEKQEKGEKISIFFEMSGAGLSNLDMEFVQYLISLFKDQYPYFLNYIIIFEMPWILNAAWKVIKAWMPGKSAELVKFVGRADLKDYVPVEEQLAEWGGPVSYHYVFEPEFLPAAGPVTLNGQIDDSKKKVHFAEDTASNDSTPIDSTEVKKPVPGQLLQLSPTEEIVFRREDGETTGLLTMTNTSDGAVAYKIKTTSPDKYRVRPSAGVLSVGSVLNVTVHIQSGYSAAQLVRDKFLVMACTVDSETMTNQQLSEVWKKTNESALQQHRLRCSVAPSDAKDEEFSGMAAGSNNATAVKLLQDMSNRLETLTQEQQSLHDQLKQMRFLLLVLLFLALLLPFYMTPSGGPTQDGAVCHVLPASPSPTS